MIPARPTFPRALGVAACVAATAALASGCGSGSGSATRSGRPPAAARVAVSESVPAASAEVFSTAMYGLWTGTATGTTTSLITWMLPGFGAADQESQQLAEINGDLQAIQAELQTINETLVNIDDELDRQTCDTLEATSIGPYTSRIDDLWVEYQTLLGWKASTDTFATDPDPGAGAIEQFIANAMGTPEGGRQPDGGYSLGTALTSIWTGLDPAGSGAYGVLGECIKALGGPPAPGTTDDRTYYDDEVVPMEEYYYTYQLEAFEMMAEAYHYQAWQADGSPTGDAGGVHAEVCGGEEGGGEAGYLCQVVANYVYDGYGEVVDQWTVGGAPYSDGEVMMLNGTGLLFAQSPQAFTQAQPGGASCPSPVGSAKPCGPLVGPATLAGPIEGDFDGLSGWAVASAGELGELINPSTLAGSTQPDWSGGTLASWLSHRGLVDPGGPYIVLTPETGEVNLPWTNSYTFPTVCFIDTQMEYADGGRQPFCDTGSGFGTVEKLTRYTHSGELAITYPAGWIEGLSYDSFYGIELEDRYGKIYWHESPGWRVPSYVQEFHWPVLETSDLTCTDGNPHDNPAGVPTLCGDDLATYIETYVPPPGGAQENLEAVAPPSGEAGS